MAKTKDYFGLDWIISIILAIIPVTSWICGAVTRLQEGRIVAFLIRLLAGWNIIYILDLISMILSKRIIRVLNI